MHFVNDINARFDIGGRVNRLIAQGANLIDAVIRRGVQFQHIQIISGFQSDAGLAHTARIAVLGILTVDGAGQYFSAGGFPGPARTGEQIRVGSAALRDLFSQCPCNRVLSDHIRKNAGTPFPV